MISVSRLLCENPGPGDHLRYTRQNTGVPRPIVVWNCTRQCNLHCIHCYASAKNEALPQQITTEEGKALIGDLAFFGVPVLLFSGGEPLLRTDLFELAAFARSQGVKLTLSTNGTLITRQVAEKLRQADFNEVGISLDGLDGKNDYFRGQKGAFEAALHGFRNCVAQGQRVSLRFTITRYNYEQIPDIFRLVEQENIDRICFYHLAYAGRGDKLRSEDLDGQQAREVMETICHHTVDLYRRGLKKEVLTVDNHADGVYIYLKLKKQNPERAANALALLKLNGGNNSGIRIAAIDDLGNVHPDQFWWHCSLGNIRQKAFSRIWSDISQPVLNGLRNRKNLLKGRCARCRYLLICNGNLRVRAEAVYGDIWAEDPACYLTDEEIGLN